MTAWHNGEAGERVLVFIRDFSSDHGVSPTVREIAAGIGRTPTPVHQQIKRLLREGKLRRAVDSPMATRSLVVVES